MSIADQITRLNNAKANIKQSIENKGVTVSDSALLDEYAGLIDSIEINSGGYDDGYSNGYNDGYNNGYDEGSNSGGENLYYEQLFNAKTNDNTFYDYLFYYCTGTSLDLSSLDTNNVYSMGYMFHNCQKLTSLDVSNFNTGNVTYMVYMFGSCKSLTTLDLSNFNTSKVISMSNMFNRCQSLISLNLSNFDMTKVTGMTNMFYYCDNLQELYLDNCSYDTISKIITSSGFPTNAIDGVTRTIYCKEENAAGLTPPTNWVFSYVTEEEPEAPVDPPAGDIPLYEYGQFTNNSELTEVSTMVTSEHTDLSNMFCSCSNLTTVNGTDKWDTSNVNNMNTMFMGCNKLIALDASKWNTTSVTTMDNTFCGCHSLLSLDVSNWDVGNVAVMYGLFYNCRSLTTLNLSKWNTSLVENMGDIFYGCESLQSLDLSNWDASNSYNMNNMLYGCNSLQELHLDNCSYDTISKIINADGFPTDNLGTIYCKYTESEEDGLVAPGRWSFDFIDICDNCNNLYCDGTCTPCEYCGIYGCDGQCQEPCLYCGEVGCGGSCAQCENCGMIGCDGSCAYCEQCGMYHDPSNSCPETE